MTVRAEIIADTHGQIEAARITTFQVYMPRFLLAEVNTHRVLSKSAESSRAIPVKRRVEMVKEDPYVPTAFGKNKRGMQADENLGEDAEAQALDTWMGAVTDALFTADALADLEVHKQQANRVLEPFAHVNAVITATEWDNFWNLRTAPAAQPEFRALATLMKELYDDNNPKFARWHLPYILDVPETEEELLDAMDISAARCARVSYKVFSGDYSKRDEDITLARGKLIPEGHLSPFDHQAYMDSYTWRQNGITREQKKFWDRPEDHRQFWGWVPNRVFVEQELGMVCRRSSWKAIPDDE